MLRRRKRILPVAAAACTWESLRVFDRWHEVRSHQALDLVGREVDAVGSARLVAADVVAVVLELVATAVTVTAAHVAAAAAGMAVVAGLDDNQR